MKGPFQYSLMLLVNLIFFYCQAQVGIGTNSPNAAAQLEVNSNNKGFLLPRLTATQRDGISNPPAGLMLFCTNCGANGEMQFYDGTNWKALTSAVGTPATYNSVGSDLLGDANYDQFGLGVALSADGTTLAASAPGNKAFQSNAGMVRVYRLSNNVWTQLGANIFGEAAEDQSGFAISISADGNTLAIGAPFNIGGTLNQIAGHVRVYRYTGSSWVKLGQDLDGINPGSSLGRSVALSADGNTLAAGAPGASNGTVLQSGEVKVYRYANGVWTQLGSDIEGQNPYEMSGYAVSISADGNRVAVGAPTYIDFDDFLAPNHQSPGFVRIYEFGSGGWNQLGSTITGDANNDHSGSNIFLSSDGTTLAIGAPEAFSNIIKTGTVKIYRYTAGNWVQLGTTLSGSNLFDGFGAKVALSSNGNILTVGTPYYDNGSGSIPDAGRIQQFVLSGSTWMQTLNDITGTIAYDSYGIALSVSGDGTKVAVGVPFFGSDKGMVQVFRH
jgi:hypothetical protein